jgi:hypothetical protein
MHAALVEGLGVGNKDARFIIEGLESIGSGTANEALLQSVRMSLEVVLNDDDFAADVISRFQSLAAGHPEHSATGEAGSSADSGKGKEKVPRTDDEEDGGPPPTPGPRAHTPQAPPDTTAVRFLRGILNPGNPGRLAELPVVLQRVYGANRNAADQVREAVARLRGEDNARNRESLSRLLEGLGSSEAAQVIEEMVLGSGTAGNQHTT